MDKYQITVDDDHYIIKIPDPLSVKCGICGETNSNFLTDVATNRTVCLPCVIDAVFKINEKPSDN